MAKLNER